jgi:hypothetical protein
MFITMHVSFRCTHEYYVQILGCGLQSTISSPWQHYSPLQMQLHHVRFLTISIEVLTGFALQIWFGHIPHHCQEAALEQWFHREMGRLIQHPVFVIALVAICLASSLMVETSSDMVTTGRKLMQVCIQDFVQCNTPAPLESARNPTTAPACPMACATASVISRVESSPAKQSMHQSPTSYCSQMPAYKCSLILKITSIRNTRGCFTMLENI